MAVALMMVAGRGYALDVAATISLADYDRAQMDTELTLGGGL